MYWVFVLPGDDTPALARVFRSFTRKSPPCWKGSLDFGDQRAGQPEVFVIVRRQRVQTYTERSSPSITRFRLKTFGFHTLRVARIE